MAGGERLSSDRILMGRRAALYLWIRRHPGQSFLELHNLNPIGHGALSYHLQVLEQWGHVRNLPFGRQRLYYPLPRYSNGKAERHALSSRGPTAGILRTLRQRPSNSLRELHHRFRSGTRQATAYHAARLLLAGLVHRERQGRRVRLIANPGGCCGTRA